MTALFQKVFGKGRGIKGKPVFLEKMKRPGFRIDGILQQPGGVLPEELEGEIFFHTELPGDTAPLQDQLAAVEHIQEWDTTQEIQRRGRTDTAPELLLHGKEIGEMCPILCRVDLLYVFFELRLCGLFIIMKLAHEKGDIQQGHRNGVLLCALFDLVNNGAFDDGTLSYPGAERIAIIEIAARAVIRPHHLIDAADAGFGRVLIREDMVSKAIPLTNLRRNGDLR